MPIEDFKIGKVLGKGAFSSVLLVKRIQDNKTYAMKRVKIGQLSYKDKQNALNEIRILASLAHPNIIGYKEAFFDDITQTLNIVMEFADDGDIQSKIKNNQKKKLYFTEDTIWNLLIQILEGLNYLHENKIMHRDLKSANIFINKDGIVKIGDLNVSKVTQFGFASTHTGTPYYASPEVWKDNPYDYKCDIWSIGVILYELCTLKVPFRGTNLKTLVKNINSGIYENISSHYSKELNLILSLMLIVNPNQRKSAKELLMLDFVKEKNNRVLNSSINGQALLMKTIKIPCNLNDINRALPKKRYNDNEKMMENDEYEIMKESIKEGGFGINFKELICENDDNNNNINNNNKNNNDNNNNNSKGINVNNNNINVQNNNQVKKPIIIKKKSAIDDLYDKIFNRKNNNNNSNNNYYNNNKNNHNYNKGYNNNFRNQENNKNYNIYGNNNNNNKNLNFDNNNKKIENVVNNIKMEDIVNENYQNKEINNGKIDNQNINYNSNKDDKRENNYVYGKNDMKKENDNKNNIDTMGKLENKINNYKNELENLRNKFNNRKNENYGFVNKINLINNNNNNYNNFRIDNENERKKQLMNKINKIKMNYNKNINNPNKYQIIEKNPKENNNKYTPNYYYKNDNSINNNNNKKNELFENEFKNLENKYKYNKQIQLKKDVNNNIGKYQKMNNYNYYNYNNIYSNQERVNQRPISANLNNYNFNKGDDFFNQFKEKYNINNRNNQNREKSPLIGRRNYLNNERKNEFEKYNLNEYMRNNNRINLNNYLHKNQNSDKNQYKYQNYILKKPYDFNNNYFNNNKL